MIRFMMNPSCLINKLGRRHSNEAYEQLLHDEDQDQQIQLMRSKKRKHGSLPPKGCMNLFVGKDEDRKKYSVPHKYFEHPKMQEFIDKYREFVLDPRSSDPIILECSTQTFEQFLRSIVKNR